jgi:hypothetical protein
VVSSGDHTPHFTNNIQRKYSSGPVSMVNTFQDIPRLCETPDNTERYIQGVSGEIVNILGGGSMGYSE